MDLRRVGRSIRALRIRRNWRQRDLAAEAHVSASQVSRIETGDLGRMCLDDLRSLADALGAELDLRVRWHGEGLDRLLDAAHADLADGVVRMLTRLSWETAAEVTFNHFGERGSVDVLGWHAGRRALLVTELKSVVPDHQAMLSSHDRKVRLGREIAHGRGWDPVTVASLLVIRDSRTSRRRISEREDLFRNAYPDRSAAVRRWLRDPSGPLAGLLFLPDYRPEGARRPVTGRQRVRRPSSAQNPPKLPPGGL